MNKIISSDKLFGFGGFLGGGEGKSRESKSRGNKNDY